MCSTFGIVPPLMYGWLGVDLCTTLWATVQVKAGGFIDNKGWVIETVDYNDSSMVEEVRIRGFRLNKVEQLEKIYNEAWIVYADFGYVA
nr:UDP-sugar pyrophosphorylase [Ipomoea batatas]